MKQLMYALAEAMSFEDMVLMMSKFCNEYKDDPSKDLHEKITMQAHMICLKEAIEMQGGIDNLTKRLDELQKADEFFKPSPQ